MSRFEPTPSSLRRHVVPTWFEDAKLGIFVHWSLSCVPAFAARAGTLPELLRTHYDDLQALSPYAEWYWNALRIPGSPAARHHAAVWGDARYQSFRDPFEAMLEGWDPRPWADLFAAGGARYVVQVTKHHDGYCLWPTQVANPNARNWHAKRDVVGDLAAAVRARGLRFGVYYSGGLDWTYEARPIRTLADGLAAVPLDPAYARAVDAQFRELIEQIRPSVLWNDIAYPPHGGALWRLLADYYDIVAKNGNLLLNVGPTRDGEIHPRERLRLEALGAWLARNGEAIYGTRPWRRAEGATACGVPVRFTCRGDAVYATLLASPRGPDVRLPDFALPSVRVELLGYGPLSARREANDLFVAWPHDAPEQPAHAIALWAR